MKPLIKSLSFIKKDNKMWGLIISILLYKY